uniref:RGS domain-containing protein n=1 Tax=Oryzias sinensis TaxID=183150 RepID=A0A8C7XTY3_9TELE
CCRNLDRPASCLTAPSTASPAHVAQTSSPRLWWWWWWWVPAADSLLFYRPSSAEVRRWAESLEALLTNQYGLAVFRHFLRSEFSEENLDFWLAVERFKNTRPFSKMAARAVKIQEEFISANAARQVNVDASVREMTNQSLRLGVTPTSFQLAQDQIFSLMETDSYPRFLKSRLYAQLADHNTKMAAKPESHSRSVSQA